ncbi:MAG: hypothetical protein KGI79_00360 [Patescibacteria group bacterium]|nr:hypothetical protein [Patescibacteria group bacterium]MDE2116320.1 hypothetical protein [Patescibacteria group bacterium]
MFKRFLIKQAMKSQLKDVPAAEQEALLDLVERNPVFFETLAKELQESLASGKDQQAIMTELMSKHRDELVKIMQKQ